ncbi:LysE family translocator [Corynebacterium comes]|uniref:Threonine efflux protein n=1 Tax=Corynebacterium comes TaxID=2675218 RepID=A0A6B8VTZ6_9CORY|nr:LysE family translocator [Corynebacterium comes]QGU03491.1 Threonine efflux protein [Corynebacterium comes]
MTPSLFLSLLTVWVAAIVSPGPDVAQVIRLGVRSRTAGVWTGLGIMTGTAVWIAASMLGLSALLNSRPGILAVLQVLGGAYLLWMGAGALRSGLSGQREQPGGEGPAGEGDAGEVYSPARAWRIGTATNLSNPKAVLFFGAVFAQFIRPGMGWEWSLLIMVVLMATGVVWFMVLAFAVRSLSERLLRNARAIDVLTGLVFVGLALYMLVEGVTGLG